jgi:hypothetical protein
VCGVGYTTHCSEAHMWWGETWRWVCESSFRHKQVETLTCLKASGNLFKWKSIWKSPYGSLGGGSGGWGSRWLLAKIFNILDWSLLWMNPKFTPTLFQYLLKYFKALSFFKIITMLGVHCDIYKSSYNRLQLNSPSIILLYLNPQLVHPLCFSSFYLSLFLLVVSAGVRFLYSFLCRE